jgi:lipopolysaccharide/colanic/teichoic acid biosynthesis glycosyltransferase
MRLPRRITFLSGKPDTGNPKHKPNSLHFDTSSSSNNVSLSGLHKPTREAGARVLKILNWQHEFEQNVASQLKRYLGERRLNELQRIVRTNRGVTIRAHDLALATMMLPGTELVSGLASFMISLEDPSASPIFKQARVGKGGKQFEIYKLRTMFPYACSEEFTVVPGKGDPRVTRVGGVLRATKIDELKQLWNILIGDMSFVGPRPWVQKEIDSLPENLRLGRLAFKPGLTSIASLRGNGLSLEDRALLDIMFMERMSVLGYYLMIASTGLNISKSLMPFQK